MKLWNHFKTINKHKYYVMKLCFRCGLYKQGLLHDLSKYSFTELKTGAKYYSGKRSPNAIERETLGYSKAWLHHKGRNKHHWEYWVDFAGSGVVPAKMPIKYVVEMFCDRVAATMVYAGMDYDRRAPLDYYRRTHFYYVIEDNTDAALRDMLEYLASNGLEQTIPYIRKTYLGKKR